MKRLHCLLSVLLACLLIFAPFSNLCYATEDDTTLSGTFSYDYIDSTSANLKNEYISSGYGSTTVNNGDDFSFYFTVPYKSYSANGTNTYPVLIFKSALSVPAGNSFSITVSGVDILLEVSKSSSYVYEKHFEKADCVTSTVKVIYSDGTFDLFKEYNLVSDGNGLTFTFSCDEALGDVTSVEFNSFYNIGTVFNAYGSSATYYVTVSSDACKIIQSGSLSDEGLIDGIIEWLKSILQSIKELPDKIGVWINNVITAITELPDKILEGIKGLFIPSEEEMTVIKDKFDLLMKDRFGALYEAGSFIVDITKNFTYQGEKTEIEFPFTTVNLKGTYFKFGGWKVKIIPTGFEAPVRTLKLIIGIVATLAFFVMLRNKFNKIIGDNT